MPASMVKQLGRMAALGVVSALAASCAGRSTPSGALATSAGETGPGRGPAAAPRAAGDDALAAARYWRETSAALDGAAYPRDFSAFVFGDLTGDPLVEGPVAAGGSVRLAEAAVNTLGLGVGLVAGRDVDAVGGSVHGAVLHGGVATLAGTRVAAGAASRAAAVDFEWAQAELTALSDSLAARPAAGAAVVHRWGGISLTGVDAEENVFEVSGEALARAPTVEIAAPAGAVVIVNVRGRRAALAGCGLTLSGGIDRAHLLWNLPAATELTVHAATVPGTVLAPRAAVALTRASIQGTLVAGSLASGAAALQYHPFVGFDAVRPRRAPAARPPVAAVAVDPGRAPVALTGL